MARMRVVSAAALMSVSAAAKSFTAWLRARLSGCRTPPAELLLGASSTMVERDAGCFGYRADERARDRRVMGQLGRGLAADGVLAMRRFQGRAESGRHQLLARPC